MQLPYFIAILSCMVVVIVRWKRHSRISTLAVTGLGLILIHALVFTLIYFWMPIYFARSSTQDFTNVLTIVRLVFNTTLALAFAPLLASIFVQRPG